MGTRLGLTATVATVVAVAALAFGTSSASASTTKLCKINSSPSPCPTADIYPKGSSFKALGTFWMNGEPCEFILGFTTTAISGSPPPLPTSLFLFEFTHCPSSFSVKSIHRNWSFPITITGTGPNGKGEFLNGGFGTPELEVGITGVTTCFYKMPGLTVLVQGGSKLSGTVTGVLTGGTPCASSPVFEFEGTPSPQFWVTE
jgi:hypothetical protein